MTGTPACRARWRGDVAGIAFVVVLALLFLSPALKDGWSFGPTDLGQGLSLLTRLVHPEPLHNSINGDIITQSAPWNGLDWRLVHHGELPLWNGLSGTGLPQLLNFESAPFALPTLLGYLAPLGASMLVTVLGKLLLAGTGAYVAARVLRCGPLAAAFAGASFMLAGSFSGWLGWSVSGPVALAGWILSGALLAYRSRRRAREVVLLALAVAFCIYGGFPESYVLIVLGLGIALVAAGCALVVRERRLAAISLAGTARVAAGVVAGGALSAPLLLPGAPLLSASARNGKYVATGIPLHSAVLLFAQGYYGLPIRGSFWFGPVNYYETAAYLGVVAIVLALFAAILCWRRPIVIGLALATLCSLLVVYDLGGGAPVQHLLARAGLSAVALQRMQPVLELFVALLAAVGLETAMRRWRELRVRLVLSGSTLAVGGVLVALWTQVGDARAPAAALPPSDSVLESLRRSSLLWPTGSILLLLVLIVAASLRARRGGRRAEPGGKVGSRRTSGEGRLAAAALCAAQGCFLLFAGVGLNSYSHQGYPLTPALAELRGVVGGSLVALDGDNTTCGPGAPPGPFCGVRFWRGVGLYPEMNLPYGIDELAAHDPTIPQAYFDAWPVPDSGQTSPVGLNLFAPSVDSAALARLYGAAYILAQPGRPRPPGTRLVTTIAGEGLYAVPGASRFGFAGGSAARVLSVSHPGDRSYVVEVRVPRAATLLMRITDVSGWHALAAGHELRVERAAGDLMQAEVPAGTSRVVVEYWPPRLTEGIALALAAAFALLAWALLARFGPRRRAGTLAAWAAPPTRSSSSTSVPSTRS